MQTRRIQSLPIAPLISRSACTASKPHTDGCTSAVTATGRRGIRFYSGQTLGPPRPRASRDKGKKKKWPPDHISLTSVEDATGSREDGMETSGRSRQKGIRRLFTELRRSDVTVGGCFYQRGSAGKLQRWTRSGIIACRSFFKAFWVVSEETTALCDVRQQY